MSSRLLCLTLLLFVAGCGGAPGPKASPIPLYAQDRYVEARVALHKLDLSAAERAAREALKEAPDFVEARLVLAEALLRRGKERDGLAELEELERIKPGLPEPNLLRGMLAEQRGDLPKAQEFYQQARASYDTATMTREQALDHATASYLAQGRLAGFQALDALMEKYPEDPEAQVMRSQITGDNRTFFLDRVKPVR